MIPRETYPQTSTRSKTRDATRKVPELRKNGGGREGKGRGGEGRGEVSNEEREEGGREEHSANLCK